MKTIYLFGILCNLLLFLASCGSQTTYICSDGSQVTDQGLCPMTTEEIAGTTEAPATEIAPFPETSQEPAVDYTLSDSEKALLEQRLGPGERAELSTPLIKNLHPGDVYVAALGIQNILGAYSHDFVVDIKFREGKDFSNSIIPIDDELVQAWVDKSILTDYTLNKNEEVVLPLIVAVGDTITNKGDPTLPGTYIYDVYVSYRTDSGATDPYQNLILTVQVAE